MKTQVQVDTRSTGLSRPQAKAYGRGQLLQQLWSLALLIDGEPEGLGNLSGYCSACAPQQISTPITQS